MLALTIVTFTQLQDYYIIHSNPLTSCLGGWKDTIIFPLVSFFIPTRRLCNQIYACAEIVSPTPLLVFAHMDHCLALAASCGPQGSHFCTNQLLEGGVGVMFAFPSLCSFYINNIAAELFKAREGACDTQLLQD